MPKVYICSGAPLSGKSTWSKKQGLPILSCDAIREDLFGYPYQFKPEREKEVWNKFYKQISLQSSDFIVDNTVCKRSYLNEILKNLPKGYEVEIVKFEISLLKSYYRNIKRWIFTSKFIPFFVIRDMKTNYKKLWKDV